MKNFKELKDILEDYNSWGSTHRTAMSDVGAHYIENPEQLARINAFIESYMGRDYIDVTGAFNHLRARLNVVGIDFDTTPSEVSEGSYEFPIVRHGGSFGTTPEHDLKTGFYRDNGTPGYNFVLKADVAIAENGAYKVNAKIVSTETPANELTV